MVIKHIKVKNILNSNVFLQNYYFKAINKFLLIIISFFKYCIKVWRV